MSMKISPIYDPSKLPCTCQVTLAIPIVSCLSSVTHLTCQHCLSPQKIWDSPPVNIVFLSNRDAYRAELQSFFVNNVYDMRKLFSMFICCADFLHFLLLHVSTGIVPFLNICLLCLIMLNLK